MRRTRLTDQIAETEKEHMNGYFVRNPAGLEVCKGILQMFYGNLWETTLDRMDTRFDGYVQSLYFAGEEYRVYRRKHTEEIAAAGVWSGSMEQGAAASVVA